MINGFSSPALKSFSVIIMVFLYRYKYIRAHIFPPSPRTCLLLLGSLASILLRFDTIESAELQLIRRSLESVAVISDSKEEAAATSTTTTTAEIEPQWVEDNEMSYLSGVCCGTVPPTFQNHPSECGTDPMPAAVKRRGISFSGRTDYRVHVPQKNVCGCRHYINGTEPTKYRWEAPDLPSWGAKAFCNLLGDRRLLLVGDSVMNQLAVTIMNAVFPEPCATRIFFGHSDTLVGRKFGFGGNRGLSWREWIHEFNYPDLVMMGTGNHLVGISLDEFEKYWNDLVRDMGRFSREDVGASTSLVWVTQPGHGCSRSITRDFDQWNWTEYEKLGFGKFSYDQFVPRTKEFIIPALKERKWPFIDLEMLLQRTDGHVDSYVDRAHKGADCTHFCMPGPLDVFPPLVLEYLMSSAA